MNFDIQTIEVDGGWQWVIYDDLGDEVGREDVVVYATAAEAKDAAIEACPEDPEPESDPDPCCSICSGTGVSRAATRLSPPERCDCYQGDPDAP